MRTILMFLVGLVLGVPISYFFQSEAVRMKYSLGRYIQEVPELVEALDRHGLDSDAGGILTTIVITCIATAIIFALIGSRMGRKKSA